MVQLLSLLNPVEPHRVSYLICIIECGYLLFEVDTLNFYACNVFIYCLLRGDIV